MAEESILNLKPRDDVEGEFIWKLASGRHCEREEGIETWKRREVPAWVRHTGATEASDGWRDGNTSYFASISPPWVGTAVSRGWITEEREMGWNKAH